jgi:phosphate transport system substrate-binding protein
MDHRLTSRLALPTAAALLVAALGAGAVVAQDESMAPGGSMAPAMEYPAPTCVDGTITVVGSTALQPLVDEAAREYAATCTGSIVSVQGGGSGTGLTQVLTNPSVQIGDSDVTAESKLEPADAGKLVDHVVARQGWIMVTNPDVTGVTGLTTQQAADIWTGKITNWKDVGGPDESIVLIIRPASSGTRATFKSIVLGGQDEAAGMALTEDSNGAVTETVAATPGATSVIGFAFYQANADKLQGLELDGVAATVETMASGEYKLAADGHMYTNGEPEADSLTEAFLAWMMSPAVQQGVIPGLYYAPVVTQ